MKKANRYTVSWYNRCLLHLVLFKTNGILPCFFGGVVVWAFNKVLYFAHWG